MMLRLIFILICSILVINCQTNQTTTKATPRKVTELIYIIKNSTISATKNNVTRSSTALSTKTTSLTTTTISTSTTSTKIIDSSTLTTEDDLTTTTASNSTSIPTEAFNSMTKTTSVKSTTKRETKPFDDKYMSFDLYARKFNKTYKNYIKSKSEAMKTFTRNQEQIIAHNQRVNETYKRKIQIHSDLTMKEKKTFRMGFTNRNMNQVAINLSISLKAAQKVKTVNYTKLFPPVKDQGYCGCCYAFSSVSILEYMAIKQGKNESYSEQNIIDCDYMDSGCSGGWPGNTLTYVKENGIADGSMYAYEGWNNTCRKDSYKPYQFNFSEVCVYSLNGDEKKLKSLVDKGPVVGAMATTEGFTSYSSGVFYDANCSSTDLDHAITIVGYGNDNKLGDFWIIRNSWGQEWGMNGYGWLTRNKNNHCGIGLYAITPC